MSEKTAQRSVSMIIFGSFFSLVGGFFLFMTIRDFIATLDTYTWDKVPAQIQSIEIGYPQRAPRSTDRSVFELLASYDYTVNGIQHQGTQFLRAPYKAASYEKLADHKWQIIRNEVSHAYVDPQDASVAILERGSLWSGLLILFPIPFVVIGTAVLAGGLGWLGDTGSRKKASKESKSKTAPGGLIVFGSIFLAAGLGVIYMMGLRPFIRSYQAQSWEETPCKVIWSRVVVHRDDEGSETYRPEVFFEYQFDGDTFRSSRYSFIVGSSSGRSAKQRIVDQYPAGKETTCFVDPSTPWHAVIRPDRAVSWFWLLGLLFAIAGIAIITSGMRKSKQ